MRAGRQIDPTRRASDRLHADEFSIDGALVRRLVDGQFPQFAARPIRRLEATGSTNLLFRLGDDLLIRMPRQPGGGASIDKERRWGAFVGRSLPVAVPEIVAVGEPAHGFGERWSIARWLPGDLVTAAAVGAEPDPRRSVLAVRLADVIIALRGIEVTAEARADPGLRWYRGSALADFDDDFRSHLRTCRSIPDLGLDLDLAERIWAAALKLPGADEAGPDRWYHGDLVAENLLVSDGGLTAVLDFGALSIGDPTIDLHGAWEIFDPPAREVFRARLGCGEAEWLRARAWALGLALGTFGYYGQTMPGRRADRLTMARNVLVDAAGLSG